MTVIGRPHRKRIRQGREAAPSEGATDVSSDERHHGSFLAADAATEPIIRHLAKDEQAQDPTDHHFHHLPQHNPLAEVHVRQQVERLLSAEHRQDPKGAPMEYRRVLPVTFARVCPLTTPESARIGLSLQLAREVTIDGRGRPLAPYLGRDGQPVEGGLRVAEEFGRWIGEALPSTSSDTVLARLLRPDGTAEYAYKRRPELDYALASADQWLSFGASLVPFLHHNDAVRAVMGAKALKEALPLVAPEIPIVATGFEERVLDGATLLLSRCKAPVSGTVRAITPTSMQIETADGTPRSIALVCGSEGAKASAAIRLRPTVAVGDAIVEGDCIADGPGMRDGKLALGVNLLVAYLPYKGLNFEDAIVISASAAHKLTSDHLHIIEPDYPCEPRDLGISGLTRGVVQEGAMVHGGDVVASVRPLPRLGAGGREVPQYPGGRIRDLEIHAPVDIAAGTVSRVVLDHGALRIEVAEEKPAEVGDKLAGRHGNKGVIARIIPDAEMPWFEIAGQRHRAEAILNPHGVLSRMNLGQLLETHWGWVLECAGERGVPVGRPFAPLRSEELRARLQASGLDQGGKARLFCGRTGDSYHQPVVIGYQYFIKLPQLARRQLSVRGGRGPHNLATEQPSAGRRRGGGQRIGEMEFWTLLAHGAFTNAQESLGPKADDLRAADTLHQGAPLPGQGQPETPRALRELLRAGLLELTLPDASEPAALKVRVRTAIDVLNSSAGEIADGRLAADLPDGLFSLERFGARREERRTRTGHITLVNTVLHPWAWPSLRRALLAAAGDTVHEATETAPAEALLQDYWCGRRQDAEGRTGSDAILPLLERYLPATFWDRWQIAILPVLPPAYRAVVDRRSIPDIVRAYRRILAANQYLRRLDELGEVGLQELLGRESQQRRSLDWVGRMLCDRVLRPETERYRKLLELWDHKAIGELLSQLRLDAAAFLHNAVRFLFADLRGRIDGKEGMLRQGMQGRRIDYSGRAVIVPAPDLPIDHCYLPLEILVHLLEGELGGLDEQTRVAMRQGNGSAIRRAGEEVQSVLDRTGIRVLLNRQPTLHPHNLVAFLPRVWEHRAIGLPPLYCGAMNADFDGDTMAVYLPISAEAQAEATNLLDVRRHVTSAATGQLVLHLAQDLVLGAYYLSLPAADPAVEAWKGRMRALFATELGVAPQAIQAVDKAGLRRLADDAMRRYGTADGLERVQRAMAIAFEAATRSGLSLSYFDLEPLLVPPNERAEWQEVLARGDAQEIIRRLDRVLRVELARDNPASLLYLSGARGSWEQVLQLVGLKGLARDEFDHSLDAPPILHNLYDGLSPFEYLQTCHTARRTLVDKKVVVGHAGALTRDLVESSYAVRLAEGRCDGGAGVSIPVERAIGRVLARPVSDLPAGVVLTADILAGLRDLGELGGYLLVRSPATCAFSPDEICQDCYGHTLPDGKPAIPGSCIGIVAALSIGERGTQLSMQTFHSGGLGIGLDIDGARRLLLGQRRTFDFRELWAAIYGLGSPYRDIDPRHFETVLRKRLAANGSLRAARTVAADSADRGFLAVASYRYGVSTLIDAALSGREDPGTGVKAAILLARATSLAGESTGVGMDGPPGHASETALVAPPSEPGGA